MTIVIHKAQSATILVRARRSEFQLVQSNGRCDGFVAHLQIVHAGCANEFQVFISVAVVRIRSQVIQCGR